jgi:Tfp pilus assembly protein PilE
MRGFRLIDLITIIAILGTPSAIALPEFVETGNASRVSAAHALCGAVKYANAKFGGQLYMSQLGKRLLMDAIAFVLRATV